MLLCETTGRGRSDAEDLAIFVNQLAALGVPARVATGSFPRTRAATCSSTSPRTSPRRD